MRKFLRKANRGLILGTVAIIVLLIYVISDYKSFSSEKSTIRTTLENYITDYYVKMSQNDYEAIESLVKETWTSRPVMPEENYWYLTDKEALINFYDEFQKGNIKVGKYVNPECSIKSISVKKCGPGMAYATVRFEVTVEGDTNLEIINPFEEYAQGYMYSEEDTQIYVYMLEYESDVYLVKEDGQWGISQSSIWNTNMNFYVKGEE